MDRIFCLNENRQFDKIALLSQESKTSRGHWCPNKRNVEGRDDPTVQKCLQLLDCLSKAEMGDWRCLSLPFINNILDKLGQAQFISLAYWIWRMDIWQIPIKESSRKYTVQSRGFFEWNVMPFGLHSPLATFQRALDNIIGLYMEPNAFAYLDSSRFRYFWRSFETFDRVFRRLKEANMKENRKKCLPAIVRSHGHDGGKQTLKKSRRYRKLNL